MTWSKSFDMNHDFDKALSSESSNSLSCEFFMLSVLLWYFWFFFHSIKRVFQWFFALLNHDFFSRSSKHLMNLITLALMKYEALKVSEVEKKMM